MKTSIKFDWAGDWHLFRLGVIIGMGGGFGIISSIAVVIAVAEILKWIGGLF